MESSKTKSPTGKSVGQWERQEKLKRIDGVRQGQI